MRAILVLSACALVCASASLAQKPAEEPTSSVSGRVFCADTNAPARKATVMLAPVDVAEALKSGTEKHYSFRGEKVQTMLDCTFTIPHVDPGTYYVIASQPGYLSPLLAPVPAAAPTEGAAKPPAIAAPRITVQAGLPVNINVTLERGASVSGTVLFDDGSPASGLSVTLMVRGKESWAQAIDPQPIGGTPGNATTDDQGNYRIAGLPPRKYLVQVMLNRSTEHFEVSDHGGSYSSTGGSDSITFYSGSKSRVTDAVSFSLSTGEDRHGEDIQIPLSKLHTIRGSILAARDGHVLNAANIGLLYADDNSELSSTSLSRDDQDFTFSYVPEGDYILKVDSASDVDFAEPASASQPSSRTEDRILRTYGSASQPIHITGDVTGIVLSVPDQPANPKP